MRKMYKIKIIKTNKDYKEALEFIEGLIEIDTVFETEEDEQLQIVTALVKDYEKNVFPEDVSDPIEAIKFRMNQKNLKSKDLLLLKLFRKDATEI